MLSPSPCFALVLLVFRAQNVFAEESSQIKGKKLIVMIAVRESMAQSESIVQAISAYTENLGVEFRTLWIDKLPALSTVQAHKITLEMNAAAILWWDISDVYPLAYFYLLQAEGEQLYRRTIDATSPTGAAEELALIVRSWVSSLVQDGVSPDKKMRNRVNSKQSIMQEEERKRRARTLSDKRQIVDREKPWGGEEEAIEKPGGSEEEAIEKTPRKKFMQAEISYVLNISSSDYVGLPGVSFTLGIHAVPNLYLFSSYIYFLPMKLSLQDASLRLERQPIWLGARLSSPWGRWEHSVSLAFSVDYTTKEVVSTELYDAPTKRTADVHFSFVPMFYGSVTIVDWFRVYASIGIEVFINRASFGNGYDVIFDPWPVQPIGTLGASMLF